MRDESNGQPCRLNSKNPKSPENTAGPALHTQNCDWECSISFFSVPWYNFYNISSIILTHSVNSDNPSHPLLSLCSSDVSCFPWYFFGWGQMVLLFTRCSTVQALSTPSKCKSSPPVMLCHCLQPPDPVLSATHTVSVCLVSTVSKNKKTPRLIHEIFADHGLVHMQTCQAIIHCLRKGRSPQNYMWKLKNKNKWHYKS